MQTITIHGRQPLHGSIRPAAAKNSALPLLAASLLCGGPCPSARRARPGRCGHQPGPFAGCGGRRAALRRGYLHPSRRCSLRRDSRLPGRGHAQLGVLFGAAALPGGVCAAAPAGRLPPGAASCGYPPGRVGLHGGRGRIRRHRRDAAAQRAAAWGGFHAAAAQRRCYNDTADGRPAAPRAVPCCEARRRSRKSAI